MINLSTKLLYTQVLIAPCPLDDVRLAPRPPITAMSTLISTKVVALRLRTVPLDRLSMKAVEDGWSLSAKFAMERTPEFIKVWSWARYDYTVPLSVRYGSPVLDTESWGNPVAYLNTSCDFSSKFGPHQIVFDCGDWAGQDTVYAASGCPSTCVDFVNNNPAAFENAYFEFNSITVYEPQSWSIYPRRHHGIKRGH
ncbi:hypothetical protein D9757_008118 [Collybiopsis confluens]|uniref:Uncharacterized protein n=1 Tax=Collybiopsis confluens TaxID=2823264 RepID=A0A8H5HDF5_9AGAR|nr:hypothetical protein D9757_008118 [Collybiopsis confluens]